MAAGGCCVRDGVLLAQPALGVNHIANDGSVVS
jgi:hypothetical protein